MQQNCHIQSMLVYVVHLWIAGGSKPEGEDAGVGPPGGRHGVCSEAQGFCKGNGRHGWIGLVRVRGLAQTCFEARFCVCSGKVLWWMGEGPGATVLFSQFPSPRLSPA
jgi:hypothetical protein